MPPLYGLCLCFASTTRPVIIDAMLLANTKNFQIAANHLASHDPILRPVIARFGLPDITPHTEYYRELVESIVGQQLSVKAAASIRRKFNDLFGGVFPSPEQILEKAPEELRSAGLSWAKTKYIQDLAQHVLDGKIKFDNFDMLSNDEIIRELIDVKGIGEWTVHMFLIFGIGRLDVLPTGDLGIKNGVRALYSFETLPTSAQVVELAEQNHWHPYESVASWYIWESLDNKPSV